MRKATLPASGDVEAIARHCRRLVGQRALLAAGVAMVPIPGLDWVTDVGVLVRVLPEINHAFGCRQTRSSAWRPTGGS